jgi:hypothetical protein
VDAKMIERTRLAEAAAAEHKAAEEAAAAKKAGNQVQSLSSAALHI